MCVFLYLLKWKAYKGSCCAHIHHIGYIYTLRCFDFFLNYIVTESKIHPHSILYITKYSVIIQ